MGTGVRHYRSAAERPHVTAETAILETPAVTKPKTNWLHEAYSIFWLIAAVLGFHSFIAKPFYIPSESMVPGLRVGDRLVVSKFAYGWSFVSPTVPNPAAIFKSLVLRESVPSWSVQFAPSKGRLFGSLPERGDVVIVTPPGKSEDYIKRVIGLPGDRLEVRGGVVILNGKPVKRVDKGYLRIPVDANQPCADSEYPGALTRDSMGNSWCQLPVFRETLPNGRSYDTIDLGYDWRVDNFAPITIPANHVFLMGDNRDRSADSRVPLENRGLGGAIPYENLGGRAEFITFSFDGNWGLRGDRSGTSLHAPVGP